jgi:hypothetical protein
LRKLFPSDVDEEFPIAASIAVFPDVNPLPGAENKTTIDDRDLLRGISQNGADVGGHIVRAFGAVDIVSRFRDEFGEEVGQILEHIGVGIFLDRQAGGGVAQEEMAHAHLDFGVADDRLDCRGDFVEAFAAGAEVELGLVLHGVGELRIENGELRIRVERNPLRLARSYHCHLWLIADWSLGA